MSKNALMHKLGKLYKRYWPYIALIVLSLVFFYPVWFQNKVPLPADALVGAHVPWTELSWEEYPAGVPIKNLEISDSFSQFYPWRTLVGDFWRAGKAPLWNPYMLSGTPFLATLHSAALYPFNALYLFLSDIDAWTGLVFLQIVLSAIFMYLFLSELGIAKTASFLGALAFSFSGYMIAWLEFATGGHAGLWLPLLLWLELKLVRSKKIIWLYPIPIIFFFIYTAGDFQVPFYITVTYFLFGAYLLFKEKLALRVRFKMSIFVVAGFFLGVLLSSPQILPTLELFSRSVRIDDPYIVEYFYGLMHWGKIVNFIWPDFFGNVVTRNYWGKFGFHEYMSFVGVVSLIFLVYSSIVKKTAEEKFFWVLLAISLLFLFPTPLGFLPYGLRLPALSTSSASRIIFLVDFCLITLAAHGFSKWLKQKSPSILKVVGYFLVITVGVALGLGASVYLIKVGSKTLETPSVLINLKVSLRNMIPSTLILIFLATLFFVYYKVAPKFKKRKLTRYFLLLMPSFVLFLAAAELLRFAWKSTPFSPHKFVFPETEIIRFLEERREPLRIAGGIPTNLFMPYKISSAEGYDPIYPKRTAEWLSGVNFGHIKFPSRRYGLIHSFSSPLINYANIRYVVDYKKNIYGQISERGDFAPGVESPRYKEVFTEGRIKVFENTQYLPRVWLSRNYKVITEPDQIIDKLVTEESVKERLVIVEREPEIPIKRGDVSYEINNFKRIHNLISLDLSTSEDALLFLSESYYPGWRAFVDGQEVEVLPANYVFQAISVPRGAHSVNFIYDPKSFKIGQWLAIATALFLISGFLYGQAAEIGNRVTPKGPS